MWMGVWMCWGQTSGQVACANADGGSYRALKHVLSRCETLRLWHCIISGVEQVWHWIVRSGLLLMIYVVFMRHVHLPRLPNRYIWVDATLKNILRFNVIFWKSSQVCFQHSECGKSESRHSNDNIALLVLLNIQGTRLRDILKTIKFKLCASLFCPKGLEMFKCWIIDIQMVKHLELWVDYDRWSVTKSD